MRIALATLLAVAGCGAGLTTSVEHAQDAVRAQHLAWRRAKAGKPVRVESLGDGCYIVDDRTGYGCFLDGRDRNRLTCIPAGGDPEILQTSCRTRVMSWEGADCVEHKAPDHCHTRVNAHDREHRRPACTARMRTYGDVELDIPLRLGADAMDALASARGSRWSGTGAIVAIAGTCTEATIVRTSGIGALDRAVLEALAARRGKCGITTVNVFGFESCVF